MAKEDLETKANKAILRMADKVTDMSNVLYDISAKLCHIVTRWKDYYGQPDRNGYYK